MSDTGNAQLYTKTLPRVGGRRTTTAKQAAEEPPDDELLLNQSETGDSLRLLRFAFGAQLQQESVQIGIPPYAPQAMTIYAGLAMPSTLQF